MYKLRYIFIFLMVLFSCEKDEDSSNYETPEFMWMTNKVKNEVLFLTTDIQTSEKLPDGELELKIDGNIVNTFVPKKGIAIYTTSFEFSDTESHEVTLTYHFYDDRPVLSQSYTIQKELTTTIETSSKDYWVDY